MKDTEHLRRSPANARRLNEAMADITAGPVVKRDPSSEFERQMTVARKVMKKDRNALRELAKR